MGSEPQDMMETPPVDPGAHEEDDAAPQGISFHWRGEFADRELNALHAEAFEHELLDDDWNDPLYRLSLGWVTARDGDTLAGFVNVAWDGRTHAFIADTMVAERVGRRGIGKRLIEIARRHSSAAGCEWLHVDFEPRLRALYFDACGFTPTDAGLIRLR